MSTERTGATTTEHAMNHVLRNLVVVAMLSMMSCATVKESVVDDSETAASVRSVKELYEKVGTLNEQVRERAHSQGSIRQSTALACCGGLEIVNGSNAPRSRRDKRELEFARDAQGQQPGDHVEALHQ